MSLRTKIMLSIFVFMVLVVGLLTLNLWLDAAARDQRGAQRNADLVASMVSHMVRVSRPQTPVWTQKDWVALGWNLEQSPLISGYTVVEQKDGELNLIFSSATDAERIVREERDWFEAAFDQVKVERGGKRIYIPVDTPQGQRFAARLDLSGLAAPPPALGDAMRGILTIMVLGTALLLLAVFVITNRLVLRPLDRIVEASSRVARGDFTQKIPDSASYDEMGRTIRAFNLMLDTIAAHHRTLEDDVRKARGQIKDTEHKLFAAQRLSTTGTLAAGIAHEINNPLGGMINAARALRAGGLDDAKRAEYLALVEDGLERVRAIVQKILQFRPRPFEPRPVALRDAVDQAAAFLEHRTKAKEVAIRNELPADLPPVDGDPLELQQAFLNILMNAVDACVMGEGMVTVYHRASADGALWVSVADNGCGMDEDELARCLDPFFSTKDVGEGTGLGLAVAHNIVSNHGGKVEIESRRGQGSTVTLVFPVSKSASPSKGGKKGTEQEASGFKVQGGLG